MNAEELRERPSQYNINSQVVHHLQCLFLSNPCCIRAQSAARSKERKLRYIGELEAQIHAQARQLEAAQEPLLLSAPRFNRRQTKSGSEVPGL